MGCFTSKCNKCECSYNYQIGDEVGAIPHETQELDSYYRAKEWHYRCGLSQRSRYQNEHLPAECQDDHQRYSS